MLVVTWLGGLTWLVLVSAVVSVPADDVEASSASAAAAFVSLVVVGSKGLPAPFPMRVASSDFRFFNLLPSLLADDVLCGSLAVLSAPVRIESVKNSLLKCWHLLHSASVNAKRSRGRDYDMKAGEMPQAITFTTCSNGKIYIRVCMYSYSMYLGLSAENCQKSLLNCHGLHTQTCLN